MYDISVIMHLKAMYNNIICNCHYPMNIIASIDTVTEPTALTLNLSEMSMHAINISWHPIQPASVSISHRPPTYLLTIRNTSSSEVITVSDPYYIFTAPSCEVYNFSVTEWPNYVGATYTGASCSVPSPVLSMMLPSLPDTSELESSLRYHLVKLSDRVIISVLFEVRNT